VTVISKGVIGETKEWCLW